MPWVTVKLASSLDGKTALANGLSQWITAGQARQDVQRHRAKSCAILSGSGTVLADDPSLNVRYQETGLSEETLAQGDLRQPLRVILDGRNQLKASLKLLSLPGEVLVINSQFNSQFESQDFPAQVKQWQAPYEGKQLELQQVFKHLGTLQLNHIWVEAGAKLAGALLQNSLIDELILYQAPKLLGAQGQDMFAIDELTSMQQAYKLDWQDIRQLGCDIKLTALVQYPAA
jgi:diaminohydroxyphosphoribosylaminopyrimidine deaminase/5-amino-6-(5-phosphoribosylamino)uracil reductase